MSRHFRRRPETSTANGFFNSSQEEVSSSSNLPTAKTSSMKRHHQQITTKRKRHLDNVIEELAMVSKKERNERSERKREKELELKQREQSQQQSSLQEKRDFQRHCVEELIIPSRKAICKAMAFCLKHPNVIDNLKDLLMEDVIPVETRLARWMLLSDILYNSQQPGIRQAFLWRDGIAQMTPQVLKKWHLSKTMSRWDQHALERGVRNVLGAWANWGVFPNTFLDELEDKFEGRETKQVIASNNSLTKESIEKSNPPVVVSKVGTQAQGTWSVETTEPGPVAKAQSETATTGALVVEASTIYAGDNALYQKDDTAKAPHSEEDGEPLEDVVDQPVEGDVLATDTDGESLDADDVNNGHDDVDGELLDDDVDGESLEEEGESLDGEPLEDEDGESLGDEDML